MTTIVRTKDGRGIAVESFGPVHGVPVIALHGMPGSRFGPLPRPSVLHQIGVRVLAYDRPGYGDSDRFRDRSVAHAADDVAAIADTLGLERFTVLGRSGGGPHALACAGLLPDRVIRAAALAALAPRDADGLDWFAGMTAGNVTAFGAAAAGIQALTIRFETHAALIRRDPVGNLPFSYTELSQDDRTVVADSRIRAMMASNFKEAVKSSPDGWLDDILALASPWGFDPADIHVPVLLWQGADDVHTPPQHMDWLHRRIPGSRLKTVKEAAHFGALKVLPHILGWLATGQWREGRVPLPHQPL